MKDFDKIETPETDKVVVDIPVPTEKKLLTSKLLKRGMHLWEVNMTTGEVSLARIKTSKAELTGKIHHEIQYDQNFYYVEALNKKNALRKWVRRTKALIQMQARQKARKDAHLSPRLAGHPNPESASGKS